MNLPLFANENTLLMTVSVETVRSAKSRPSKNLSERSVSVSAYLLCFIVINLTFVISDFTYNNAFRLFFGRHRRPHVSMLYHFKLPLFEQSQYHFSVLSGIGLSFILTTDQLQCIMLIVRNQVVIGELVENEVYLRRNSHSIFFHVVVAKIY